MAYDPIRRRTVLFGGSTMFGLGNDTWVWDGNTWTAMHPALSPLPRYGAAFAYEAAEGRLVLFGGWGPNGLLGDTWEWDGVNWTQRKSVNAPEPRVAAAMSAAADGGVVLFGGSDKNKALLGDTWTWNGRTWTHQPASNSPQPRDFASMAYDAAHGAAVLFGGQESVSPVQMTPSNDTWIWQKGSWTLLTPSSAPDKREDAAMASDTVGVVLFGGVGYYGNSLADTWRLSLN
jgi:hypothetical protein